jgi:hypothetical protein
MKTCRWSPFLRLTFFVLILVCAVPAIAQVNPAEIPNSELKSLENAYFQQLMALNQSIARMKFPFPFYLSRFVGLDPAQQAEADTRGLEFVRFQDRSLLKVTGNYNAAYDTLRLTRNERAAGTLRIVILPILSLVTSSLPEDMGCDGVGFEISHHTRTKEKSFDYEGKEIVVVVLERADAWALAHAATDAERQEIVNRSKVFVNGVEFGLSLTERDALDVRSLSRSVPAKPDASSTARSTVFAGHSALTGSLPHATASPAVAPAPETAAIAAAQPAAKVEEPPPPPPTQKDADRLGETYRTQLAALANDGAKRFNFVDYAPPAFVIFHDQLALQISMRNTISFGPGKSSIYKRAAESFDLFLAPKLADLSGRIPADMQFQLFDFSVMNRLGPGTKGTSEAIEFICPRPALRRFVSAEITNQQLLDQSVILVNGVRIALNLQLVE